MGDDRVDGAAVLELGGVDQGVGAFVGGEAADEGGAGGAGRGDFEPASSPMLKIGDICPECGQASVINEEGCRKCYSCGYSEC